MGEKVIDKSYNIFMKTNKKLTILEYELPVLIQQEKKDGFIAKCSIWNDCYAQGDSVEEVINEISAVAAGLIELYKEEGLKIPLKIIKTSSETATNMSLTFPLIVASA